MVSIGRRGCLPLGTVVVVEEVAKGRAFPVVEMPVAKRTQHERKQHGRKQDRQREGDREEAHDGCQRSSRIAFAVTTSDEPLIAIAADKGSR